MFVYRRDNDMAHLQLWYFNQGYSCPSSSWHAACSGNGVCDCNTGTCTCNNACFKGDGCSVVVHCGPHSSKGCANGQCQCDPCWTGPFCDVPVACGDNQFCSPTSGTCVCDACYSGVNCTVLNQCSGSGVCNSTGQCVCNNVRLVAWGGRAVGVGGDSGGACGARTCCCCCLMTKTCARGYSDALLSSPS